jgi:hypothetical protein
MKSFFVIGIVSLLILTISMVRGFVLLDYVGVQSFGFLAVASILALLLSARMLRKGRRIAGCVSAITALIFLLFIAFPRQCFRNFPTMELVAGTERQIRLLNRELKQDHDLSKVRTQYMHPSGTKQSWVQVTGTLGTDAAFVRLKNKVDAVFYKARYDVRVGGVEININE